MSVGQVIWFCFNNGKTAALLICGSIISFPYFAIYIYPCISNPIYYGWIDRIRITARGKKSQLLCNGISAVQDEWPFEKFEISGCYIIYACGTTYTTVVTAVVNTRTAIIQFIVVFAGNIRYPNAVKGEECIKVVAGSCCIQERRLVAVFTGIFFSAG